MKKNTVERVQNAVACKHVPCDHTPRIDKICAASPRDGEQVAAQSTEVYVDGKLQLQRQPNEHVAGNESSKLTRIQPIQHMSHRLHRRIRGHKRRQNALAVVQHLRNACLPCKLCKRAQVRCVLELTPKRLFSKWD